MSGEGWILLYRKMATSDLWLAEPFTRGQAWIDLLILANHKDGLLRVRGISIPIKRGQIGWSEVALSKRWRWSRGKFRRFLNELKFGHRIERQTIQQNKFAIGFISILNYDSYQFNGTTNGTTNSTTDSTTDGTETKNEERNINIYVIFEDFRLAFPGKKRGAKTELENFLKKNNAQKIIPLLMPALLREMEYRKKCEAVNDFVPNWKNLSTYINQKSWETEFPVVIAKVQPKYLSGFKVPSSTPSSTPMISPEVQKRFNLQSQLINQNEKN
jgi:hypothetical protein